MTIKWKENNWALQIIVVFVLIALSQSQYCNQTLNGSITCFPCYYRCKQCSGLTDSDCLSCTKQYILVNKSCMSCGDNCFSCKSINDTSYLNEQNIEQQCQTCIQGYYLYQSIGKCIKCPIGAETCTLSAIQSCSAGYYLMNGVCIQCQANCMNCSNSAPCSACKSGYYLDSSSVCTQCPISNCLSCQSVSVCNQCQQGFWGDQCEHMCENRCGICFSGICYVCKQGFYMLNGTCEPGRILCKIPNSYVQCSECLNSISSIGSDNSCVPFYTVHDQNRLIYLTALNNYQSFSSLSQSNPYDQQTKQLQLCPILLTYIMTSQSQFITVSTQIQPSYKISLVAQLFVTSLSFTSQIKVNNIVVDPSSVYSINGDLQYQCGNKSFFIVNLNTLFTVSNEFNSSNTNLSITFNLKPSDNNNFLIGTPELYLQLNRCRVSFCLLCKSPYTCQTCLYPYKLQNNECIKSCSEGYYLTQTNTKITCTLECSKGFFPVRQEYTCKQCLYPCVQCLNQTTCSKCYNPSINSSYTLINSNETYFLYDSQCVSSCPNKYFADTSTYQCQDCVFPCQECIGFDKCTSCKMGYLNSQQFNCVAKCPSGQYSDFLQLKCLPCQTPCSLCQYSAQACLQCITPFYLYQKNSSCLVECPVGYAMLSTSEGNQCKQCEFPCKSCESSQSNCTSCMKGYLYNNGCYSQCPGGFYKSTTVELNNICLQCENNCLECVDKEICISCQQGYKFNTVDKSCIIECPKSTYSSLIEQNNTSNVTPQFQCLQCIPPCYDCTNASYCLSCTGLLFLNHLGQCLLECPLGTYIFYNSTLQERQCMLCEQNCIDCVSETTCNECKDGWLLLEGKCYDKCPAGTFENQRGYKYCEYCEYPCMQCLNEYECVSCVVGFMLEVESMKCVEYCSDGYFESVTLVNPINNSTVSSQMSVCLRCSEECERCADVSTNCLSCARGFYFNNESKLCGKECPEGTYYSESQRVCTACQYPCKTCVSYSSCVSCYLFNETNNTSLIFQSILYLHRCIEECPSGYYQAVDQQNVTTCIKCLFPCQQCSISPQNCTKCKLPSLTFYNFSSSLSQLSCLNQCPQRYFEDSYACELCQQPCYECESDDYCSECIDGWYLLQGHCYQGYCPFHYFKAIVNQISQCIECDSTCRECQGKASNCTSCLNNYYLTQLLNTTQLVNEYTCTKQCAAYYYGSSQSMQCVKCQSPCLQCHSKSYCITCTQDYLMEINKCVTTCSQTFYQPTVNSTYCSKCIQPCQKCQDQHKCLSCIAGYYFLSDNSSCVRGCPSRMYGYEVEVYTQSGVDNFKGLCLLCSQLCLQCSSFSVCISCDQTSDRKYLQMGRCQSSCTEGYYPYVNNQTNQTLLNHSFYNQSYPYQCLKCQTNCVSCSSYDICNKCVSSYLYENRCISECPLLYYGSWGMRCENCVFPCMQCYNQYNCKNCVEGYFLYNEVCVKHCPQSLWSDQELRQCVIECDKQKYKNTVNRSCVRGCERFYSIQGECVDECWGLDNKENNINNKENNIDNREYLINSSGGCQLCNNTSLQQQEQCVNIYNELSYSIQEMVVNGKLIIMIKFNSQVMMTLNDEDKDNVIVNDDSLKSFIGFRLQGKDRIQQQLQMQFVQSILLHSNNSNTNTQGINSVSNSIEGFTSSVGQDSKITIVSNHSNIQSNTSFSIINQNNIPPSLQNKIQPLYPHSYQSNYNDHISLSSSVSSSTTNNNNNSIDLQPSYINQFMFSPSTLFLQLQSLPQSLQQSFSGYLTYSININNNNNINNNINNNMSNNYLQLLSLNKYKLSPQSLQQPLPLQSVQQQTIQIQSFSPSRKIPQWFNQLMKYISNIFSYLIVILIFINLIMDNLKSQFHLIDFAQNMYLLFWVCDKLQLGITPFLLNFNISAFIINSVYNYQSQQFKQVINNMSHQQLLNCTPKQLIYGNACQYKQYFLNLLPFIAAFIIITILAKLIIYFKPFIQTNIKIHHKLFYNHVNNFYWLFITPIFFISVSQFMFSTKINNSSVVLNLILIIFTSLVSLILMYQILKNVFNCSYEEKTFFWGLKCHKIQNEQGNIHFLLLMIRKSIILIAANINSQSSNNQLVFVFLLVFVSIIILSNILANSPFKKRLYQYLLIICEVLLIVFYLLIEIYIVIVKNLDQTFFILYNSLMFIVTLVVVTLHSIIAVIETVKHIKKKYQQYHHALEEKNDSDSKSSSCDTSSKISDNKKELKQVSKYQQHQQQESNQFVLLPASLEKFKDSNSVKGSNQALKTKQAINNSPNQQQNEQTQTKHQKLNNSQESHYQAQDSQYESSSGFELHSVSNSQQFSQPAKYLIKLQKNVQSQTNSQNQ